MCKPVAWDTKPTFTWYKFFGSVLSLTPSGSSRLPRSQDKLSSAQSLECRRDQSGRDIVCGRGSGDKGFSGERLVGVSSVALPALSVQLWVHVLVWLKGCPGRRAVWAAPACSIGGCRWVHAGCACVGVPGCQGVQRRRDIKLGVKHTERHWIRISESWFWQNRERIGSQPLLLPTHVGALRLPFLKFPSHRFTSDAVSSNPAFGLYSC